LELQQHGLVLNAEKCLVGVSELDYQISAMGIRPITSRVEALSKFPQPISTSQLQTFLGMINFYRRFLPGAAKTLKPLTDALQTGKADKLEWTEPMKKAFRLSKAGICAAAELAHPESGAALFFAVDASSTHVGATLQQEVRGQTPRPLAFFSAKLTEAQVKYSAFDRELLACYLAIRHFRWILEGQQFYILTDHKPLTFALHQVSDASTARQQRQLSFVAEYISDVRHVAGKSNVVADALSRPAAAVASPAPDSVDFAELARQQATCTGTGELAADSSLKVEHVAVCGHQVLCEVAGGRLRPLVPVAMRCAVFQAIHGLAHPGTRATRRQITSRYVWRGCVADMAQWCRECKGCSRGKVTTLVKTPVEPIAVRVANFSTCTWISWAHQS
jgi:RNase H-like domain found in reverse transcriptase/Integrase zinc binding domain